MFPAIVQPIKRRVPPLARTPPPPASPGLVEPGRWEGFKDPAWSGYAQNRGKAARLVEWQTRLRGLPGRWGYRYPKQASLQGDREREPPDQIADRCTRWPRF